MKKYYFIFLITFIACGQKEKRNIEPIKKVLRDKKQYPREVSTAISNETREALDFLSNDYNQFQEKTSQDLIDHSTRFYFEINSSKQNLIIVNRHAMQNPDIAENLQVSVSNNEYIIPLSKVKNVYFIENGWKPSFGNIEFEKIDAFKILAEFNSSEFNHIYNGYRHSTTGNFDDGFENNTSKVSEIFIPILHNYSTKTKEAILILSKEF